MAKIPMPSTQVANSIASALPQPLRGLTNFAVADPLGSNLAGAVGIPTPQKLLSSLAAKNVKNPVLKAGLIAVANSLNNSRFTEVGVDSALKSRSIIETPTRWNVSEDMRVLEERKSSNRDPMFNIDWRVEMPSFFSNGYVDTYIEDISVPFANIQQSEGVFNRSTMKYYAAHQDVNTFSVKFYEDNTGLTSLLLQNWKDRIRDSEGNYSLPKDYKGTIKVKLMDVTKQTVMSVEFVGCFPIATESFQLSSMGTERVVVTQEFSVDSVIMNWGNEAASDVAFSRDGSTAFTAGGYSQVAVQSGYHSIVETFNNLNSTVGNTINAGVSAAFGIK